MTEIIIAIVAGVLAGAIAAALMWGVVYRKRGEAQLEEARRNADRVVADASKTAEGRVREADLEAKEKRLQIQSDFDRKVQQRNDELKNSERRLQQKEENLDKKTQQVESRTAEVEKRDRAIDSREKQVIAREDASTRVRNIGSSVR